MADKFVFPWQGFTAHDNHGNRESVFGFKCANGTHLTGTGFDKLTALLNATDVSFTRDGVEVSLGGLESPFQTRCDTAERER
jgi:hypothetical protein